mgnify:CR=1 FL=1
MPKSKIKAEINLKFLAAKKTVKKNCLPCQILLWLNNAYKIISQNLHSLEKYIQNALMMKKIFFYLSLSLLILNISCLSKNRKTAYLQSKDTISGKVIAVHDGDTYDLLVQGNEKLSVRMEGIDAPERGMPFYQVSKRHLSSLCSGKQVTLKITGTDNYGRALGFTYLEDGRELGQEMIKAGLAWHYKKYNSDTALANFEKEARRLKKGLWLDKNPKAPWEVRRLRRQGVSAKDSFNISPH